MSQLGTIPEWLGTAAVGALVAALGYVTKLAIDIITKTRQARRERRSRLLALHALLRASRALFETQNEQARTLYDELADTGNSGLPDGVEQRLGATFHQMSAEQRKLHAIIRSTTVVGIKPLNDTMLEWLQNDSDFRTVRGKEGIAQQLANALRDLETHLLMWRAKYEAWIPPHPEHALVYLADELQHGPGFPKGLDKLVEDVLDSEEDVTLNQQSQNAHR